MIAWTSDLKNFPKCCPKWAPSARSTSKLLAICTSFDLPSSGTLDLFPDVLCNHAANGWPHSSVWGWHLPYTVYKVFTPSPIKLSAPSLETFQAFVPPNHRAQSALLSRLARVTLHNSSARTHIPQQFKNRSCITQMPDTVWRISIEIATIGNHDNAVRS
jgi:hypothetical protein